jgi:hypothetical protein
MINLMSGFVSEIFTTNFFWNNVSMGVICTSVYGYAVRECVFVGNSISKEFYGGITSSSFSISGTFFRDVPGSSGIGWRQVLTVISALLVHHFLFRLMLVSLLPRYHFLLPVGVLLQLRAHIRL